ncbi:hypothetical protein DY000_02061844 [Brassica cretica]|uniref:Uncharacterized protein n=1 Tax=Brassica cretica TaxID=69181 RepID=A0ABQ7AYF6_BRACR|nr:hypothetical protein DY000_02061844 [Brassica cretica]
MEIRLPEELLVLVEGSGCSRAAILNRPPALNPLTTHMGVRLHKLYRNWEEDPNIGGSGRAFCAGGDIVSIYHLRKRGSPDAIFWTLCTKVQTSLHRLMKSTWKDLCGDELAAGNGDSNYQRIFAKPEKHSFDATQQQGISEVPLGFGLFTVHHRVGHPENFETPGIEVITGPLGQGIANAVGLPLAEKHLAARFNKPDAEVVDHYTYVILGDGCQKEGIFKRSCLSSWSLETWKAHCFLRAAIKEAKAVTDKSTLIKVTTVGYESPNKAKLMLCPWSCTCHWSRHTPEGSECPWI